ncbi:MAG: beta-lactamase family protein [Propionibacteriaceae bacterium]|jgi:CubicO group peptidase (beta-lactamase class C family)|nr:beta-lactamase family protein [Propionibacteriaceae bacterium]
MINERVQAILDRAVDRHAVAGANVVASRDGVEILYAEAGWADIKAQKRIQRDTIFHIYSMTKPVTAAAVVKLAEEGELDLLEPVADFLPSFAEARVGGQPPARDVVVADLLTMTSGVPYPSETEAGRRVADVFASPLGTVEFANAIGRAGLDFSPGERFLYGAGADVAGAIVEVVTGRRLGDYLAEAFFQPLGMKDTGFCLPDGAASRLAEVYEQTPDGLRLTRQDNLAVTNAATARPAFESGGAGLLSTVDDYHKFAQMLLAGGTAGGHRLLSERSIHWLTQNQLEPHQAESFHREMPHLRGHGYGGFLRVMTSVGQSGQFGSRGEYGWDGWLGAYFVNDPATGLSLVFLTHRVDSGTLPLARQVKNAVVASLG